MTVDWALQTNYLSVNLNAVFVCFCFAFALQSVKDYVRFIR